MEDKMKRLFLCGLFSGMLLLLSAAGVLVNYENSDFQIAHLNECNYEVDINNQIAEVTVTETFFNLSNGLFYPRYYFPMPRGANATKLRWFANQQWYDATIGGLPQSPPGGPNQFPDIFTFYMQLLPLILYAPDSLVVADSIKFELTYMQLLTYNYGSVTINLKNDYSYMQTTPLAKQSLEVNVYSEKLIEDFDILNVIAQTSYTPHTAEGSYLIYNAPAENSYRCVLKLSTLDLSSWGISTYLDSVPDDGPPGFFLYTVEEESLPADTSFAVRLNIVIDVSGSMDFEDRLVNAKIAACYVINHLEAGDYFNVILFDHLVRRLWFSLHENTPTNRAEAISYITNYQMPSWNGTNLYGGVSTAITQFVPPPEGTKNCILLLSDGQPTVGITDTYQIIHNINSLITSNHSNPYIFCFGVGTEVNYQLLSALAQYHNGISIFLESAEIVNTITSFYNEMRNPIFVSSLFSVTPGTAGSDIFPDPFPAIYGGMQYRIVGRYNVAQPIQFGIAGFHNGIPVSYNYNYQLQNVADSSLSFIPKVWASAKIDKLLIEYYSYEPQSPEAVALRQQIIDLSIAFGVVCVFTSFTPDPPIDVDDEVIVTPQIAIRLLPNCPNPFNPCTTIRFEVLSALEEDAEVRIYNLRGQLVYIMKLKVNGKGIYEVNWDGRDMKNRLVSSGVYVYSIRCGNYILHAKMTMQK